MTRGKKPEVPKKVPPTLTVARSVAEARIAERIAKGNEILQRQISSEQELDTSLKDRQKWSSYNTEMLQRLFDNDTIAEEYDWRPGAGSMRINPSLSQRIVDFRDTLSGRITRLESILERLPLIPEAADHSATAKSGSADSLSTDEMRSVFVVHGHDNATREAVARFLERLRLKPIILHEQASGGRTLLEKFEAHASVAFAVVLLTPDDICLNGKARTNRARQNVIFELGYFFGTLGRRKVAALYSEGVELPSDINGLTYIRIDASESWRLQLARELRSAGIEVDMNLVV